jgi:SAM-dependent methyltransferase
MKRETTNRIRFVIEELLPPILRDSRLFLWLAERVWGDHISHLARFRARAPFLTSEEYAELYRNHPRVHTGTDNSVECIRRINLALVGTSVCDIGCGTGALLTHIRVAHPELTRLVGVDFVVDDAAAIPGVEYLAAKIEDLPFADGEFDTVVCTHVIEHVLDYRRAISELRRVARKRLIIVVPREREGLYTFNPHFNFFPYRHAFLRAMHPVPEAFVCEDVARDIFYCEERP